MARFLKLLALAGAAGGAAFAALKRLRGGDGAAPATPAPDPAPAPAAADVLATAPPSVLTATPPPDDTPGPSVNPVGDPEYAAVQSEEETGDAAQAPDMELLDAEAGGPVDDLVEAETAAAAAEAAAIGGGLPDGEEDLDPSMRPVYEAGGGEEEGFELAEADLIENATHGDGRANPLRDAPTPELESDRATAAYGEADDAEPQQDEDSPSRRPDADDR